jgi:hypothetical protein
MPPGNGEISELLEVWDDRILGIWDISYWDIGYWDIGYCIGVAENI